MISDSDKNVNKIQAFVEEQIGELLSEPEALELIDFFNGLIEEDVIVRPKKR